MTAMERTLDEIERQGKKQSDLCKHLGISTSMIAGWKKKNTIPPSWYLVGISEFLNVSVDWLLTGKKENSISESADVQLSTCDIWDLKEYQREALSQHLNMLTEEQAALINNYEKLTLHDKKEIRAIIKMKLAEYESNLNESVEVAGL